MHCYGVNNKGRRKSHFECGLSETTVRRRIRAGGLDARLEHGRYFIYGRNGVHSGEKANTQNGKEDMQFEHANDHVIATNCTPFLRNATTSNR